MSLISRELRKLCKTLELASHAGTPPNEALNALHAGRRICDTHGLSFEALLEGDSETIAALQEEVKSLHEAVRAANRQAAAADEERARLVAEIDSVRSALAEASAELALKNDELRAAENTLANRATGAGHKPTATSQNNAQRSAARRSRGRADPPIRWPLRELRYLSFLKQTGHSISAIAKVLSRWLGRLIENACVREQIRLATSHRLRAASS